MEPEPLAVVLFLLIFLENWLALSGKNDTLQEFLLSAVLPWDNTPQLSTTPLSLQSRTTVGTVSGTPGSQEIALLASVLN